MRNSWISIYDSAWRYTVLCIAVLFCCPLGISATDFTRLVWHTDTIALGTSFRGAFAEEGNSFPYYATEINVGRGYAGKTYTVVVEYPEYQEISRKASEGVDVSLLGEEPLPQSELVTFNHEGILRVKFIPIVRRDGRLWRINSFRLRLSEGMEKRGARSVTLQAPISMASASVSRSVLAQGRWVKISVPQTGVFKLSNAKLRELGFTDPAKVRLYGYGGNLLPEHLKNLPPDDLCEAPLWRINDGVLFYGRGVLHWSPSANRQHFIRHQNFYATAGYYFLTEMEEPSPFPQAAALNVTPNSIVQAYNDHLIYEVDSYNWASSGRELYDSYDYAAGATRNYSFSLPGVLNETAYCSVDFATRHTAATTLTVAAGNTTLGTLSLAGLNPNGSYYNYYKAVTAAATYAYLTPTEQTTITLTHNRPSAVTGRLNYLSLSFRRQLQLYGSHTSFRDLATLGQSAVQYKIAATPATAIVWDVTDARYAQVSTERVGQELVFMGDNRTLREYVVIDPNGSFDAPSIVGQVDNQDLHGLAQPDMVIVIPTSAKWREEAERLAETHRAIDNMVVHVVTAAQVYNEFSSGTPDATAYRRFMKMFYDRAVDTNKSPSYLLMMGDCAYDNRMLSPGWSRYNPDDFLLCYQSKNSVSEINSYVTDDYLGMLDEGEGVNLRSDKMDIGVGRFPIRTKEQAQAAVNKNIRYLLGQDAAAWKNHICYAADDEESRKTNLFMDASERLATYVEANYPGFVVTRLFQDAFPRESTAAGYTYKQATSKLLSLIDDGLLMLNYTGHGGTSGWSAEFLLTAAQIRAMRNARQGLWITATCDFCRYDDIETTAGEDAFLNPNGGASALFTTSRTVFSANNDMLNDAFNKHLFTRKEDGSRMRLGDIMRLAKNEPVLMNDSNKLNFTLIGNPALPLAYPEYKIVMDSLNGEPTTANDLLLRAGDLITLKGHIETPAGNPTSDFTGVLSLTVYDTKERVVCYNHAHKGTDLPAFEFSQYNNRLFVGSDSVRDGQFSVTFPVPLDISYSNLNGMLSSYARSNKGQEAQGMFDHFKVGGTAVGGLATDSVGPTINLFLNSATVDPAVPVNPNPVLYAFISDEEGINTAGTGIGRNLVVSIDNSPLYTYILNDYFRTEIGDFTRGHLQYRFENLPDGPHTLYLTAWDTKNNATTVAYPFTVSSAQSPTISAFSVYPIPATTDLTFCFTHDRPQDMLDITFEVFDLTGRMVWFKTFNDLSVGTSFSYTWDLMSTSGASLPQGMYLYRARIATNGSEETTQMLKLIIAAQ